MQQRSWAGFPITSRCRGVPPVQQAPLFPIEIHPLIRAPVDSHGEVFQALRLHHANGLAGKFAGSGNPAVFKFQRRQRFLQVPIWLAPDRLSYKARLAYRRYKRGNRAFGVCKLGGTDQTVLNA